jgi:hypothetical protein
MTREKIAKRSKKTRPKEREAKHGVHIFLDQLREALVAEARRDQRQRAEPDPPTNPNIAETAALHGHDLLGLGFSVDEVVHDYGDVCQAVTELAVELDAPVSAADFHTLNRCLDNAIAAAVTAWRGDRETDASGTEGQRASRDERLRRLVSGSITAFDLLRDGKVGAGGATGMVLRHNLQKMRAMLEPSLSYVAPPRHAAWIASSSSPRGSRTRSRPPHRSLCHRGPQVLCCKCMATFARTGNLSHVITSSRSPTS